MSVINLDCRIGLTAFAGAAFDVAIVDPPYGDTSLKWDRQVAGWIEPLALALKPSGHVWVFGSLRFLAPVFEEMDAAGFKYSQDIVWLKQNGTGFHNDRFRRVHEHAVLFYRGKWADSYRAPQFTLDAMAKTVRRKTRPSHMGSISDAVFTSEDGGPRLMTSVLAVKNMHGRATHPTEKPVELLRPLLRYSCPPGGRVLDPFSGSAAVWEAAKAEGMSYIGFETDPAYAAAGNARGAL